MTAPGFREVKDTGSKDKLMALTKAFIDFCTIPLSGPGDSTLGQLAGKMGPNTMSRGGAMLILGEDWFDHYSTMAIYLPANGVTPRSAQPGSGRM
jgi:hypothetical protein